MESWSCLFFRVRISTQAFLSADHPFGHFPYTKPESGSFSFVITKQEIHESATTTYTTDIRLLPGPTLEGLPSPGPLSKDWTVWGLQGYLHLLPWIYGKVPCPRMPSLLFVRLHNAWELSQALLISFQALRYAIPPWLDLPCWKSRLLLQSLSGLGLLRTPSIQKGHIQSC